jgi:ferredoxin
LLSCAVLNKVDIEFPCKGGGPPVEIRRTEKWTEQTFGEGPQCFYCHVQIPPQFHHLLPPKISTEDAGLENIWREEFNSTSRLACQIFLEAKHDGMIVYVPDSLPTDVI